MFEVQHFKAMIRNAQMNHAVEVVVTARSYQDAIELLKGQYGRDVQILQGPKEYNPKYR